MSVVDPRSSVNFVIPLAVLALLIGGAAVLGASYFEQRALNHSLELIVEQHADEYERKARWIATYIEGDPDASIEDIESDLDKYTRLEQSAYLSEIVFMMDSNGEILFYANPQDDSYHSRDDLNFITEELNPPSEIAANTRYLDTGTSRERIVTFSGVPSHALWVGFIRPVAGIHNDSRSQLPPFRLASQIITLGLIPLVLIVLFGAAILLHRQYQKLSLVMQKSNEAYRQLSEDANSIILRWDTQGKITYANRCTLEFFGYKEDELVGSTFRQSICSEDYQSDEHYSQYIDDMIADPYFTLSIVKKNVRKDGSIAWVNWSNRVVYDEYGEITDIISVGNDITELKESEQRLRESEQHITTLINMAPFGAHEYERRANGELIFVHCNQSSEKMLNMDLTSQLSKPILDVFPGLEDTGMIDRYHSVIDTGTPYTNEKFPYVSDNISGLFEVYAMRSGTNRVVAFFRDVTEKRKVEQDREELIIKLQDALENVKTLHGLIPICSMCKSIRDDDGYWSLLEEYISNHSDAEFTHSLCPDCADTVRKNYKEKLEET